MGLYLELPSSGRGVAPLFLSHRLTPPRPYPQVARRRLLDTLAESRIVVLAAPSGYGKTTLASQLAAANQGPTAWFTADESDTSVEAVAGYLALALAGAWGVDGHPVGAAGGEPLGALDDLLATLATPGCLVVDEVHAAAPGAMAAVLDDVLRYLPGDVTLVLAGRREPPVHLLGETASGLATCLGAADLRFSPDETSAALGAGSADVHEFTGGWPLAVGLAGSGLRLRGGVARRNDVRALGDLAASDLTEAGRSLLSLASRVARAPVKALRDLDAAATRDLLDLAERHPALLTVSEDGWCSVRDVLREALCTRPVTSDTVTALAAALAEQGEPGLALGLLVGEEQWAATAALLRRAGGELLDAGRWEEIRRAVAALPADERDAETRLVDATAAVHQGDVDTGTLRRLTAQMWDTGTREGLWASVLLTNWLFHTGDPGVFAELVSALAQVCGGFYSEDRLRAILASSPDETAALASHLAHLLGICLRFAGTRDSLAQGRRLTDAAEAALERTGTDTTVAHAIVTWVEASSGSMDLVEGIAAMAAAAARLRRRRSRYLPRVLLGLGTLHLMAGDTGAARKAIADVVGPRPERPRAEDSPSRPDADLAPTAETVLVLCDVLDGRTPADADARLDAAWEAAAAGDSVTHGQLAGLVTLTLLAAGDTRRAERWVPRTRTEIPDPVAGLGWRFADALLRIARGEANPEAELPPLVAWCEAAGLAAQAERIRSRIPAPALPPVGMAGMPAASLTIRVLCPEIRVERDGVGIEAPKGVPARLLALLVAERGPVGIERAIETLWPDSNPDLGRNRLYGVVHRLRGALGFEAGGPLRVDQGLVRLHPAAEVSVDVWDFLDGVGARGGEPPDPAALDLYGADFCATQFAYDDFAIEVRRDLRGRFLAATHRVLREAVTGDDPAAVEPVAARACALAPDDEDLCLLAVRVHVAAGNRSLARERLATTAAALDDLGIPAGHVLAAGGEILAGRALASSSRPGA